jgi:hypothetical protein
MRRPIIVLAAAGIAGMVGAPAASAQSTCSVPDRPAWHSCLSAGHRAITGTNNVMLTRVSPILVIRLRSCGDQLVRRKVVIRTRSGDRIASKRLNGRCRRGVARWRTDLRPNVELRAGTVIQSFWSRLPDEDRAPKVKLKLKP